MSSTGSSLRVRMAPSPTGYLHVGSVRTALFNWLLARHHGGTFILRVEDTDRSRMVPGAVENMMDTLRWVGLDWDEGPEKGGPFGPYVQSERLDKYHQHAEQLLAEGKAYRCYCTEERLAELRRQQEASRQPTGYDRRCRYLSEEEKRALEASSQPSVVRFASPLEGTTTFTDLVRGPVTYQNAGVGDFVCIKSDGYPTYHFAVVVDDHLMEISHVTRGEEFISSAARDRLLYEAFGWSPPLYAHYPLILAPDRARLAKRHGATAAVEFREMGIVREAFFNYLALLGASYSADREIYSVEELIQLFDIPRVSPSAAIFDRAKLEWMNGYYINHILSLPDVTDRCMPYLRDDGLVADETPREYVEQVVALVKERLKLLSEVGELTEFFFREPDLSLDVLAVKKLSAEETRDVLSRAQERLQALPGWEEAEMEVAMRSLAEELGLKAGPLFMALRVAVTGRTVSPGLFETMRVLGRERTLERLARAAELLAGSPA